MWIARVREALVVVLGRLTGERVLVWPPFQDGESLADAFNRLCFYLGPQATVWIPVASANLRPAASATRHMPRYPQRWTARFFVPRRAHRPLGSAVRFGLVLFWKRPRSRRERLWLRLLPHFRLVDPLHCEYEAASFRQPRRWHRTPDDSRGRFLRWRQALAPKEKVYLLCTGPSLARFRDFDFSDGHVLACNSAVAAPALLAHARPDVLVAADPVFHFGPSRYASEFRSTLARAMREGSRLFVTLDHYHDLLVRHFDIEPERVIEVTTHPSNELRRLDESWSVPATANVLTLLMLPLAWALGRHILLLGADGRTPEDRGFWRHARLGSLDDQRGSVEECHPCFFARRRYAAYYEEHLAVVERQIATIESWGGEVRTLAPSAIPALASRLVEVP